MDTLWHYASIYIVGGRTKSVLVQKVHFKSIIITSVL